MTGKFSRNCTRLKIASITYSSVSQLLSLFQFINHSFEKFMILFLNVNDSVMASKFHYKCLLLALRQAAVLPSIFLNKEENRIICVKINKSMENETNYNSIASICIRFDRTLDLSHETLSIYSTLSVLVCKSAVLSTMSNCIQKRKIHVESFTNALRFTLSSTHTCAYRILFP